LNLHVNGSPKKVRDGLTVDVLLAALGALPKCTAAHAVGDTAAQVLSRDIVDSFVALRKYLRELGGCIEFVDPNLANNTGLVSRLLDWEKSWDIGRRYLMNKGMSEAICHLVAEIKRSPEIGPTLARMCEGREVELFMVLPRIMWLCFLHTPTPLVELFKVPLPHHFAEPHVINASGDWPSDPELASLRSKYNVAVSALSATLCEQGMVSTSRSVLMQRSVKGQDSLGVERIYATMAPARIAEIEDFMRELEVRSLELQRCRPRDSNELSAVLVGCMVRCLKENAAF